jgi:hypothetical protein
MENDFADKINIDDLYDRKREIEQHKLKVFRKILNRVHLKIKTTSRQRNSGQFAFFLVPSFLVGTPTYDVAACIAYIIDKLKDNGFNVKYTHPNLLFISWAHYIDKSRRMDIKKEYGINIDGMGNVIHKKNSEETRGNPENMNSLMFNRPGIKVEAEKEKNDYKKISSYKPTGFIYNNLLLKKIEDKTTKKI